MKFYLLLFALIAVCLSHAASQTAPGPSLPRFRSTLRFEGSIGLGAGAQSTSAALAMHKVILNNGVTVTNLGMPIGRWLLIHVVAGQLRAAVERADMSRVNPGELIAYPPGAPLRLQTDDDSVIIDVFSIELPWRADAGIVPTRYKASGQTQYQRNPSGVLQRNVFTLPLDRSTIEFHDLLIGPGKQTESFALGDSSVLEVRSGHGELAKRDYKKRFRIGETMAVEHGQWLRIRNLEAERPIQIRAMSIRVHAP
jgi:hypothetical protein